MDVAAAFVADEAVMDVLARLAEELAFVRPDSDGGLLAVNALLMDLEQWGANGLPPPVAIAVADARRLVDAILDSDGRFTAEAIAGLVTWHDWLIAWMLDVQSGSPPSAWQAMEVLAPSNAPAPAAQPSQAVAAAELAHSAETASIRLRLPDDAELLREFHTESLELLQSIEQAVLALEATPDAPDAVGAIFRAFHTFKGSAGFLQLDALRDLAHELESLLDAIRSGTLAVTRAVIDAVLAGADVLAGCTRQVGVQLAGEGAGEPIPLPAAHVVALVHAAMRGEVAAVPAALPPPSPSPSPAASAARVMSNGVAPAVPAAAAAVAPEAVVRVDAAKLDALVNLVGELAVAQSFVLGSAEVSNSANLDLAHAVRKLTRVTEELQQTAMSMRMVPLGGLFRKMTRLVRDLGAAQDKQVRLALAGEDTELDRQIVDRLGDPLIHMIRNAVDHGIEPPDDRIAAGKEALGTISLSAFHQHGGVMIRITDDGRGLNAERLYRKAIERRLIDPAVPLSLAETLELVFLPGLSTAAAVTDLSGRGVGMDVVRERIEALRGHVEIESTPGVGTSFTIRLPLTLAVIDGLMVGVGRERYVIPALAVRECFRPAAGAVTTVHEQGELVDVRGRQLPVLRLGRFLGVPARSERPEEGILLVIELGSTTRAVLVDELLGKQEMLIKNLGRTFSLQSLVAGGAVLADGSVGLILDIDTLLRAPRAGTSGQAS